VRRAPALVVLAALAVPLAVAGIGEPAGAETTEPKAQRVLVISIPAVTWQDIQARKDKLPNLIRLLDSSAVGGLTTRAIDRRTTLADGYVTLGAGTRSVGTGPNTDGEGFEVDEPFGDVTAGQAYARRTGHDPRRGLVNLGIAGIVEKNDQELFDAEVGALGDKLASADWSRAVIANGDGYDPEELPPGGYYRRQAVAGLMGSDGEVPAGALGPELLVADPQAPFGLRYDNDAVLRAFRSVWQPRSVVLVEASDLVREDAYRAFATPAQRDRLLTQALERTDALIGGLLREVDAEHDAVMVVGPVHPARKVHLTVASLRAPGIEAGLLRSGTTRRPGFVQLVDVAPTILDRIGLEAPDSMEGRPFEIRDEGGSASQRRDGIADSDNAATFRDDVVAIVAVLFVVIQAVLAVAALLWLARPGRRRGIALHLAALSGLGFVAAVLLARLLPFQDWGDVAYWSALVSGSMALAFLYRLAGRRDPLMSLIAALSVIVAVLVLDVLFGAPLQLSNPLGYSPLLAARFSGYGNLAYAALASAAVLLAGLLAYKIGGRRGALIAIALLAVVFVVDGMPMWGSDVGGVLSILPAFAVTGYLLLGIRMRLRNALLAVVATVLALVAFGLFDLTRPSDKRTHLGRLFETTQSRGWSGLATVIERKIYANLSVFLRSTWLLAVIIVLAFLAYLYSRYGDRLRAITEWVPELRASFIGFAIVSVLGFALNDSGIAVPGMMLSVLNPTVVALLVLAQRRVVPSPVEPAEAELAEAAPPEAERVPAATRT
jgi:hypothetical protein